MDFLNQRCVKSNFMFNSRLYINSDNSVLFGGFKSVLCDWLHDWILQVTVHESLCQVSQQLFGLLCRAQLYLLPARTVPPWRFMHIKLPIIPNQILRQRTFLKMRQRLPQPLLWIQRNRQVWINLPWKIFQWHHRQLMQTMQHRLPSMHYQTQLHKLSHRIRLCLAI